MISTIINIAIWVAVLYFFTKKKGLVKSILSGEVELGKDKEGDIALFKKNVTQHNKSYNPKPNPQSTVSSSDVTTFPSHDTLISSRPKVKEKTDYTKIANPFKGNDFNKNKQANKNGDPTNSEDPFDQSQFF
ncbi:hypothetical protein [Taylorella equigenitalis]|uniref:Uncharacterized protein n=2 Tax=Taylorella equigenitalis TaxID=29575 RepID=A0A654KHA3_TAYEM|nr:hypothetical protein [Taylorella equigenitalis]ADU91770.1 hypothetical protein TEQUI_0832 [Taylorella equigenitalis MCE9]AFN35337.1 hypothetical protein KUI_0236 [Taylorella equigenitalis ATCC 35865]ASY37304.1 hypothetical protein CA605_01015 [Taylorella equigenitalis]ASY38770.1 hypothetical protein CA604_01170 [Taylorella equigenitalis]ASY40293.1 hypothetical protein CAV20_01015 [Taylorella equigenitalis]